MGFKNRTGIIDYFSQGTQEQLPDPEGAYVMCMGFHG
jgi:hypothetical protein